MTFSIALDVGIGLILLYLLLSLLVTAINELAAQFLSLRARHLQSALRRMLDLRVSEEGQADLRLVEAILKSPTLRIAGAVAKTDWSIGSRMPSYMNRDTFVAALREAIPRLNGAAHAATSRSDLGTLVEALPAGSRVRSALEAAVGEAAATAQDVERRVGDWYDGMMERASGAYKRWMSTISLLVGLLLAVALNCDTVRVANSLAQSAALRAEVVRVAEGVARRCTGEDGKAISTAECTDVRQNLDALQTLPLGGKRSPWTSFPGWLITGCCVSLGAPFWFDVLSKVMNVRSSFRKAPSGERSAPTATR
jgi:hypothetical protein